MTHVVFFRLMVESTVVVSVIMGCGGNGCCGVTSSFTQEVISKTNKKSDVIYFIYTNVSILFLTCSAIVTSLTLVKITDSFNILFGI
jgi:hypothetical protein